MGTLQELKRRNAKRYPWEESTPAAARAEVQQLCGNSSRQLSVGQPRALAAKTSSNLLNSVNKDKANRSKERSIFFLHVRSHLIPMLNFYPQQKKN